MLGPDNLGARRRHDQAAEHGLLDLHSPWGTGDDQRNASTRSDNNGPGDQQALTGLANQYPGDTDRAVKASPPGGLAAGRDRPLEPRPTPEVSFDAPMIGTPRHHRTRRKPKPWTPFGRLPLTKPAASDMPFPLTRCCPSTAGFRERRSRPA